MKIECGACGGTGLYHGFAEPPGVYVVCTRCNGSAVGTGNKEYTGRKHQDGVVKVCVNPTGAFFTAPRPDSSGISYQEFLESVPAAEV